MDWRGISEVAGTMILIGVVVIGMMIVNLVIISTPTNTRIPSLQASMTNRSTLITIVHQGGDSIPAGQYKILVDGNDTTSLFTNSGTSPWSLGETLSYNAPSMPQSAVMIYNGTGKGGVVILQTKFPWGVYVPPIPGGSGGSGDWGLGTTMAPTPIYFPWYDCNWSYRKNITIDHTRVPASQTNFPVLVSLSSDGQLSAHARSDGNDILFTTSDGLTRIPHEIESYSSGTLVAWVNVPSLNSSADTTIMMYYGNSGASSQQNRTGVWDANYKGVWHLNETVTDESTSGTHYDSSSNGNNGTQHNNGPVTGMVGGAQNFDGSGDYITVPISSSLGITSQFTMEAWVNLANPANNQKIVGDLDLNYGYLMGVQNGGLYPEIYDSTRTQHTFTSGTIPANTWTHLVMTWTTGGNFVGYINGNQVNSVAAGSNSIGVSTGPLRMGVAPWDTNSHVVNGRIDEIRLSSTARTSQWIATEYNNTYSPSSFYRVESQVTSPCSVTPIPTPSFPWYDCSWGYRKNITIQRTQVVGTQTNFPVLISLASDSDLSARAQYDGDDIFFTSSDGITKIPHEIESYSSGTLVAWVKVPSVSSATDTTIMMYYGNPTIGSQQDRTNVWDSNYKGVWHLNNAFTDSTLNNNNGADSGTGDASGRMAQSREFYGGESISVPDSGSLHISGNLTVEAWVYPDTLSGWDTVVSKMTGTQEDLYVVYTGTRFYLGLHPLSDWTTDVYYSPGSWQHLAVTYDGTYVRVYQDGSLSDDQASSGSRSLGSNTNSLYMGYNTGWPTETWDGRIDEVRISSANRSSQWIKTEYNNQNSPSSFISVESQVASGCSGTPQQPAGWYSCDWAYRKNITIDHTKVAGPLTYFPVLISLDQATSGLDGKAQPDGDDIFFTSSDGTTKLSHEIESYSSGTLVAWVKVPSLSSTTDTTIMMYYGNSVVGSQQNPTAVWDTNYKGVWHLSETSGTTVSDSASSTNTGTASGFSMSGATGKIGKGATLDGSNDYIYTTNSATGPAQFTYETWMKTSSAAGAPVIGFETSRTGTGSTDWDRSIYVGTDGKIYFESGGSDEVAVSTSTYTDNNWHHVVGVRYSNASLYLYVDGSQRGSTTDTDPMTETGYWRIGSYKSQYHPNGADGFFSGSIDEVRVSTTGFSPQWIATEYANQNTPSSFYSVGSEVASGCSGTTPTPTPTIPPGLPWYDCDWGYRKSITIDKAKVSGTQTGFPVLVSLDAATSGLNGKAQPSGNDILFTDINGLKLPHEIETYAGGTLVAWVKVPSVSYAANTTIVMYYGNSGASSQQNPWSVWDNNYKGVWHIDEAVTDNAVASGVHTDSTENNNNGNQNNNNDVTGKIGTGQDFEGDARDEYVEIPNSGSMENLQEGDYTVEAWFNSDTTPPGTPPAWNAYYEIMGKEGYNLGLEFINSRQVNVNHWIASGPTQYGGTSGVKNNLQWYHVVSVVNKTTGSVKLYINGANEMTSSFTAGSAALEYGTTSWKIGIWAPGHGNWGGPMNGKIDEVRISSTARSPQWIATEFNNQDSPSTFSSVGSEEGSTCSGMTVFNTCTWPLRKKITIDKAKVAGSQTNFPVLVSLASDSDLAADAQDDGDDLVFTSWDGTTQLPHEIESFSGSTGALTAWVKVPSISSGANTDIYLYYGNSGASNQQDPTGVWDSNYVGVWHLQESGSGAQGEFRDSTSYANHGQGGDGNSLYVPAQVAGKVGYAQNFSNADGKWDFIDAGQNSILDITGNQITLEAWVQHEVTSNPPAGHSGQPFYGILNHKGWDNGYRLALEGDDTQCKWSGPFCANLQLPGASSNNWSDSVLTRDTWYHVAGTYNGSYMAIFVNGQVEPHMQAKSNAITPTNTGEKDVWIGTGDMPMDVGWTSEWVGKIDEVRISTLGRSDSWIRTEYNNMNSPSTFATIGSEVASGCSVTPTPTPTGVPPPWYDCSWQERKRITIDHTKVPATQTDFPVLISLTSDSGLQGNAQADGDDIFFTSSDGTTKLSHEIESYTSSNGALVAWVKVPSLSATTDTFFYMYYGNPSSPSQQDKNGVWDANYKGVWHMKETGSGVAGEFMDSTSNNNHGQGGSGFGGGTPVRTASGRIGYGQDFTRASTQFIRIPPGSLGITGSITLEAWATSDAWLPGDYTSIVARQYGTGSGDSYQLGPAASGGASTTPYAWFTSGSVSGGTVSTATWYHYVATVDGSSSSLYIDGSQAASTGSRTISTDSNPVIIGGQENDGTNIPSQLWDGYIDEVRVSSIARPASWIATEYANQNSPSTFSSVAGEETAPCTPPPTTPPTPTATPTPSPPWFNCYWPYRKNITINKTAVSGTQTNFPVLINLSSDADLHNHTRSDGYDILFTKEDGQTEIPYEREYFNKATGTLTAWVKVPQIQSSANTTIYMYYGFLSSPDKASPPNVWDGNYAGVWHLSSNFNDSTSNNNYGTNTGSTSATGQMGNARYSDGKGYITINGRLGSPATATVSAWVNLVSKGTNGAEVVSIGDNVAVRMDDYFQGGKGADGIYHNNTLWSSVNYTNSGNSYAGTGWHYLTYVVNPSGSSQIIYVDGVPRKTTTFNSVIVYNQGDNTFIGKHGNGLNTYNFTGTIDEVRVSNVARDANWISTEYKNQANPALFHYLGKEEAFFCGGTSGPSYVQSRSLHFEYVNQASITLPGSTTAGDLLVLSCVINQSNSVATVTDSKNGNAYNSVLTTNVGNWGKIYTYNVPNSLGGSGPITATVSLQSPANKTFDLFFLEYSGVASTSPVDVSSSGTATSGTSMNTSFATTSKAPALIYGFGAGDFSCSANSPYTGRETANGRCAMDQTVFMTGPFNVTATQGISGAWALQMVAFKGA